MRLFGVATMAAALLLGSMVAPTDAAAPNHSILLWKPGRVVTGTLKNRTYTRVASFKLSGVDLAAASRSSLALYTRSTGRLRTGTFRNGRYVPVESIDIRTGFTHAAASCDSLFLYNRLTGRYMTGTLVDGRFRNRTSGFIERGWDAASATCAGLLLWDHDDSGEIQGNGLSGGDLVRGDSIVYGLVDPLLATTRDSFIVFSDAPFGAWGTVDVAGDDPIVVKDSSTAFVPWAIIAGAANSLLFYNPSGEACRWWVIRGEIEVSSCSVAFPPGFTVIAGGK